MNFKDLKISSVFGFAFAPVFVSVFFVSCAHSEKKTDVAPAASSFTQTESYSGAPREKFSSAEKLKEMAEADTKKAAAETMAQMKRQIELSAFEKKFVKVDPKLSWKCVARSGERHFSKSARDPLIAKNNAQKACESKKHSAACFVSECVPNRI